MHLAQHLENLGRRRAAGELDDETYEAAVREALTASPQPPADLHEPRSDGGWSVTADSVAKPRRPGLPRVGWLADLGLRGRVITAVSATALILLAGVVTTRPGVTTVRGSVHVTCSEWQDLQRLLGGSVLGLRSEVRLYEGTPVSIQDDRGVIVGSTTLGPQQPSQEDALPNDGIPPSLCQMPFEVGVPTSRYYSLRVLELEWTGIPADRLEDEAVDLFGFFATSDGPSYSFASDQAPPD